jgi:hypothetical protein
MDQLSVTRQVRLIAICIVALLSSFSCGNDTASVRKSENNSRLVGTWILQSRVVGETEAPARERLIEFVFSGNDLFRSRYRGDSAQDWIGAGQGSFRYDPPYLTLYWDSGARAILLVADEGAERIRVHHGRNLVPGANQDPDEIFIREKADGATGGRHS